MDTGRLNLKFFAAHIQIPLLNKYLGVGYKGLKPPWLMGGQRGAQKLNLFYYRGFVNHKFKVPPM